ncbi:MAG: hypothetical protein ACI841_000552 [Planctomycetota bacterium]
MNLTLLSTAGFFAGVLALAGVLFMLQRLRVRHREVVVVTTMFWREAIEEQRARTLVERFRHPLSYLIALLVAGLLWLGVGRPDSVRAEGQQHVLLLDASAGMGTPGRFDAAVEALRSELAQSPRDRTEVLFCGERTHTLLAPGEDRALLDARLAGLRPQAVPSSLDRALRSRLQQGATGERTRCVIIGDGSIDAALVDSLPESVRVERTLIEAVKASAKGITALGVSPAASGDWTRVDLYVETATTSAGAAPELIVTIDEATVPASSATTASVGASASPKGSVRASIWPDLPATGGLLKVRFATSDDLPADDAVSMRLPTRSRIRVAISAEGAAYEPLLMALRADAAVELVADVAAADVVLGGASGSVPSFDLVAAEQQGQAILIGYTGQEDADQVLQLAVGELGLDRVDASALATSLGRPIALGAVHASARRVSLWSELMADESGLIRSRAFPILVGRAVRWLADTDPMTPYRATARALPTRVGRRASALVLATLTDGDAALLDRATTLPADVAHAATLDAALPEGAGAWRPYTWFLLIALVLLGVEWALYQRGRMA